MSEGNPTSDEWYWSKRGSDERNGPISGEKLRELAEEGDLEPDDLVWTQGMDDWEEAGSVEKLESLFVTPPSLSTDAGESGSRDTGGQSTSSERSPDVGEGEASSGAENETEGKRQEHPEYEGKERGTAIVLALLLGGFGGHRFYLGDVLKGSLYLVFSATGIPFLIGLYDAYTYYTNPEYFQKR